MPLDNQPESNAAEYANPIPAAIRRQTMRVEEIARAAGVANVPAEERPAAQPPPVLQPIVPAPAADGATPDGGQPPVAQPIVPAAAPAAVPPTEDWEQRYRTLQGKYNQEVPSLRQQVESLERAFAAIQTAKTPPAPAPTTVVVPQEDVENFGQDLVDAARRWARAEVQPQIEELRTTIGDLNSRYGTLETSQRGTVTMTARQSVMAGLDADPTIGATWRATNDSPAFLAWLDQADPFSGQQRLQLLRVAFDAGQTPRVAAFFNTFAREQTVTHVPATPTPQTPQQGAGGPRLEDLAVPGQGTGPASSSGAQQEKRVWRTRDITAFYRDVQKGLYHGREPERLRLEQDLVAAATEGRVRNT